MSDQDNDMPLDESGEQIMDAQNSGGATSTAGHGSTLVAEGNVGRTGHYNSTRGDAGNIGARDTSLTAGATASEHFDDLTGANNDDISADATVEQGERDADYAGARGAAPTGAEGEAMPFQPEIFNGSSSGGVSGDGDPGQAARESYSGHGTFSGGGSNDPNAVENSPTE